MKNGANRTPKGLGALLGFSARFWYKMVQSRALPFLSGDSPAAKPSTEAVSAPLHPMRIPNVNEGYRNGKILRDSCEP